MPLPKVEDGQTLSLRLPSAMVRKLKLEGMDRGVIPAQIVMYALQGYWGEAAPKPEKTPKREKAAAAPATPAPEGIAAPALLQHIEGVFAAGITQNELVLAVEPHSGKTYAGKGANWREWRGTLQGGKLPRCTSAILAALVDLGHPFTPDEQY